MLSRRAVALRIIHGVLAVYFIACMLYLYYAAIYRRFDTLLAVSLISLAIEGFIVYGLNHGDCPLIHIQRRIGDEKPFFEIFLPPQLARLAFPIFTSIGVVALVLLTIRCLTR
jgi:hypothetical protein